VEFVIYVLVITNRK